MFVEFLYHDFCEGEERGACGFDELGALSNGGVVFVEPDEDEGGEGEIGDVGVKVGRVGEDPLGELGLGHEEF